MAFVFRTEDLAEDAGVLNSTTCVWSPEARARIESLRQEKKAAGSSNANLPIRDLRFRLITSDRKIIRTSDDLGCGFKTQALLFTRSRGAPAITAANAAVAIWAGKILAASKDFKPETVRALEDLALAGRAVRATERETEVFGWDVNRQTGSARTPQGTGLYTALVDFLGLQLEGREIYPDAGPMRRVLDETLNQNTVSLMTEPITLPVKGKAEEVRFSLGITLSTETYPGRSLPVVQVSHNKHVFAREPRTGSTRTGGYLFPAGETRALRFSVDRQLNLDDGYMTLAAGYDLPTTTTTQAIARNGTRRGREWQGHQIVINHHHGHAETDSAMRGVPVLDQLRSFERLATLLAPLGLTPWRGIEEIPTAYGEQGDADARWQNLFQDDQEEVPARASKKPKTEKQLQKEKDDEEADIREWSERMFSDIDTHYNGAHHIVLAHAEGYSEDAQIARTNLLTLLGERAIVTLKALPEGVHGPKDYLAGHDLKKPAERADVRAQAWLPFVRTMRSYMDEQTDRPVNGIIVMAPFWYADPVTGKPRRDDKINKRLGRITLNRELGLLVQYLLPQARLRSGNLRPREEKAFRFRTVNAWRDLAWKNLGKINRMPQKIENSFSVPPADPATLTVLGFGIIRVNKKRDTGTLTSFIPYAIELDPLTGTCIGSVMLGDGEDTAEATPMAPLKDLVKQLGQHGPSYLARKKSPGETTKARQLLTQKFIHQTIAARAKVHPGLIVLLDASTLSGMWRWLNDETIDPSSLTLNEDVKAHMDFEHASILRIRQDHAPKVLKDATVKVIDDGKVRLAAVWSNADLYQVTDTGGSMETYLSFGSRIFHGKRGVSTYVDMTDDKGTLIPYRNEGWITPNAVEVTVVRPGLHQPVELAKFVEAMRSDYAHFGSWINNPGPLHFASLLKEYVPDYELAEVESDRDESDLQPGLDFAPFEGEAAPTPAPSNKVSRTKKTEDKPIPEEHAQISLF